ncbi:hypothetical protein TRVA0_073S00232 [Trichomonascus vanleenenianus]|uniref:uncharacterized protein n=1 Tax=Trichomonascus vanleenenianus TaxID=2268995 RepID=UPI003ECA3BD3
MMNYYQAYPATSSSVSPVHETSTLYHQQLNVSKVKFNAGRSFDFEDDVEFCPALSEEEINYARTIYGSSSPYSYSSGMSSASSTPPHSATTNVNDMMLMNSNAYYLGSPVSRNASLNGVSRGSARRERALEIIDPVTGGRVTSPVMTASPVRYNATSSSSTAAYYAYQHQQQQQQLQQLQQRW